MSQLSILPRVDPDDLIAEATAEHEPIATVCLFSGGNDSAATAHRCREHFDDLVWLDTGTAVPGVEDFVREFADWLGKPLRILRHEFDAFRLLVLGGTDWKGDEWEAFGFPGPPQHGRAYNRLKQRLLDELLREAKRGHPRTARLLAITGKRRAESRKRAGAAPINRKNSLVFVNPLIDWTNEDLTAYRREHAIPESDVAALLHRSGECNCSSYATAGEREMLRSLWPEWFEERIASVERECVERGVACWKWGGPCDAAQADEEPGELCSSCDPRQLSL